MSPEIVQNQNLVAITAISINKTTNIVVGDILFVKSITPASATVYYQWFRVDENNNYSGIINATESYYQVTSNDVGFKIAVSAYGQFDYSGTVLTVSEEIVNENEDNDNINPRNVEFIQANIDNKYTVVIDSTLDSASIVYNFYLYSNREKTKVSLKKHAWELEYNEVGSNNLISKIISNCDIRTITLTELKRNTHYKMRVRNLTTITNSDQLQPGDWSPIIYFCTKYSIKLPKPTIINHFSLLNNGNCSTTVYLDKVNNKGFETSLQFYISDQQPAAPFYQLVTVSKDIPYLFDNLNTSTTYYIMCKQVISNQLTTQYGYASSDFSKIYKFTTLDKPKLDTPSIIKYFINSDSVLPVLGSTSKESKYKIYVSVFEQGLYERYIIEDMLYRSGDVINNLLPNTEYYIKLKEISQTDDFTDSDVSVKYKVKTYDSYALNCLNIRVTNNINNNFTLAWDAVEGADSYLIQISPFESFTYAVSIKTRDLSLSFSNTNYSYYYVRGCALSDLNHVTVAVGSTFVDNDVTVLNNSNRSSTITKIIRNSLNEIVTEIDTSSEGNFIIEYNAVDSNGNNAFPIYKIVHVVNVN